MNEHDIENTNADFCSLNLKNFQSVDEQRKNAQLFNKYQTAKTRENREMGREDKRGGKKTRKNKIKRTKRKSYYRRSRA
jgi:hypothetical protein